jgi:hypothetical protein
MGCYAYLGPLGNLSATEHPLSPQKTISDRNIRHTRRGYGGHCVERKSYSRRLRENEARICESRRTVLNAAQIKDAVSTPPVEFRFLQRNYLSTLESFAPVTERITVCLFPLVSVADARI